MNISNNKEWTFGIVTKHVNIINNNISGDDQECFLIDIIESIKSLNIAEDFYEIIIIGSNNLKSDLKINDNLRIIYFDDTIKNGWITKKKNILVNESKYQNIIIIHDYVKFDQNWYKGFQMFDLDWDVCMVKIFNKDKIRWRDWLLWSHCPTYTQGYRIEHNGVLLAPNRLLYSDNRFTNTDMYISGTVIIGKREFLIQNKFDETLCWGQGEDCEWSARCRSKWKYKMNTHSSLYLLKMGEHSSLF
jgi:hypothetical protein